MKNGSPLFRSHAQVELSHVVPDIAQIGGTLLLDSIATNGDASIRGFARNMFVDDVRTDKR